MSHEVTCRCDKSLRQSPILLPRVCGCREGPRLVYLQTCRSDMLQVHVTRGDGMCVQHFVTMTCRMNWNWFEFTRQVAALNCIKTGMCRSDRSPRVTEFLKILASQIPSPISASMGLPPDSISKDKTRTGHNLCFVLSNSIALFIGSLVNFSFIFFIIFSSSTDISHLGKTTYTHIWTLKCSFLSDQYCFQGCRKKLVPGPFPRLLYCHEWAIYFLFKERNTEKLVKLRFGSG